jgi:HEAT repeat protein
LQNSKEFDDVRREVAFALGAIGDASAIPVLQVNLIAKDYYLAKICAEALEKIDLRQTLLKK